MSARAVRGISISFALTLCVGGIVVVVVLLLVMASYPIAHRNTVELLQEKTNVITHSLSARIRGHLSPAKTQIEHLDHLISEGLVDGANRQRLGEMLAASLSATPQVSVVSFTDPNFQVVRAFRNRPGDRISVDDWSDDPDLRQTMLQYATLHEASWGSFFFAEPVGETYINVRNPVRRDGHFVGLLTAGVSIKALSEFMIELGDEYGGYPFILYGKERVMAHPSMVTDLRHYPHVNDLQPLPALHRFGDPVLSEIWSENRDKKLEAQFPRAPRVRAVEYLGETYVFVFEYLFDHADQPLIIGSYQNFEDVSAEIDRLRLIPLIGIAVLAGGLVMAIFLGRALSRPIRGMARASAHIRELDIDGAPRIRSGPFLELNEAAEAFNTMADGLQAFETYVPRKLVKRLMGAGLFGRLASESREITVLFTDIVGFTAMAEQYEVEEVARLLNEHFALLTRQVEATGGTVDKLIGDAMMAFWGAPERTTDHALKGCEAAVRIAAAIREENQRRGADGKELVRIRMGLHSGPALIGNIGAPGRVNYTAIGDTINTASRLEALSRDLIDEDI